MPVVSMTGSELSAESTMIPSSAESEKRGGEEAGLTSFSENSSEGILVRTPGSVMLSLTQSTRNLLRRQPRLHLGVLIDDFLLLQNGNSQ